MRYSLTKAGPMSIREPKALWFGCLQQHHAFEILPDGTVDQESCCGAVDLESCADEPARDRSEFDGKPACSGCLSVVELKVPSPS